MMDDQTPVPGGVNVQLDSVRVQRHRPPERRQGVLVLVAGGAAMGDHAGSGHGRQR